MNISAPGRRVVLAGVGLFVALAVARSSGQQVTSPSSSSGPVKVDFLATGSDGRPIADLKAEDLTLKIDGRQRALHTVQFVAVNGSPDARDGGLGVLPAPFATNTAAEAGRAVVLVIDEESLIPAHLRPTQDAVQTLLSGLRPHDRVSLVTVPHGSLRVDFTTEHDRVTQALSAVTAQANQDETLTDAACRTRQTLEDLSGLLDSIGGGPAPTTVVFFTTSLTGPRSTPSPGRTPSTNSATPSVQNTLGACDLQPDEFQKVGDAATRARAYFYIARIDDSTYGATALPTTAVTGRSSSGNTRGSDDPQEGISDLAGVTGGTQFPMLGGGGGDSMLVRVDTETSAYYVLTFDPDSAERNGARHRVELKTSRDGVALRTLPEVVIPAADTTGADTLTPKAMLRDATPHRDLALRAAGYVARNQSDSRMKVISLFEPIDPLATLTSAMAGLYDSTGALIQQSAATSTELTRNMPVAVAMLVPPGTYRMRVAATDSSGHSGSTDTDVTAKLATAGPLQVSDIVLGLSTKDGFEPRLLYTTEPVALAYLEFYNGKPGLGVRVAFELARTVDGQPMIAEPAAVEATQDADRFRATAAIPIGGLLPGDYVVRALVEAEGQPFGRVVRILRKTTQ